VLRHLNEIDRYSSGSICRHRALVEYFGQSFAAETCNACDICLGETELVADALIVAQKILSCVYRLRESFGIGHVVSVLRGESNDRITERRHDQLSTYGLLRGETKHDIREWIYQLMSQGFLTQNGDEYPVLALGPRAREVLKGLTDVRLRRPAIRKKDAPAKKLRRPVVEAGPYDRDLFEQLRKWRRAEAEERGVPPYVIFSDRTLRELARLRPATLVELREVYGVGDAKLEVFGRKVLEVLQFIPSDARDQWKRSED
jgi:ATP-dependent DNA helicase RecQ